MGKFSAVLFIALFSSAVVFASPLNDNIKYKAQQNFLKAKMDSLEAKLISIGIVEPKDFLSDLIAQLGLTLAGVSQALIDTQKGLEEIVAPHGEELVNELRLIIEIAGIRAVEIFEPLLLLLKPLFPEPEILSAFLHGEKVKGDLMDLIGDLIEDLEEALGVPIHEVYYVLETTFINLETLRAQLVKDVIAVAAKAGPETVDQVEAHLINSVIRIKDEIRPLWELLSGLIPRSARFSFATSRILDAE